LIFTHFFSTVVMMPIAGVLADRVDRRRLLILSSLLRAVLVLLFPWARSPLAIYALNLALTTATMLGGPAQSALLPDIVEKDQLLDANALTCSLGTLTGILGPLLGGLVLNQFSVPATFILCGALSLPIVLGILLMRIPPPSVSRGKATLRAVYGEFVEGIRYARVNPVVSTLTIIFITYLTGLCLSTSLSMVLAERVLASESLSAATAFSTMQSVTAAGLFAGSLLVRHVGRRYPKKRVLLVSIGIVSLDAIGLAVARSLPFALAVKLISGIGTGMVDSMRPTLLQEHVEEEKLGRAFSLFTGVTSISSAIAVYAGGWLADRTSIQLVYWVSGTWVLLTAIGSGFLPGYRAIPVQSEVERNTARS
jgi:MFS family permease